MPMLRELAARAAREGPAPVRTGPTRDRGWTIALTRSSA